MSETCTDGSMARKERMPFSSDHKNELLRKLQRHIHFEKTLSATNVSQRRKAAMSVPAWFVRKYGDKFQKFVILRSESSAKLWRVKLSISCRSPDTQEVRFLGGWYDFATVHGLVEGDSLVFSHTAVSKFEVYIFPGTRSPKRCPSQAGPRKQSDGPELSRKKAKQEPSENKDEQVAQKGELKVQWSRMDCLKRRQLARNTRSPHPGSSTSCSLSSSNSAENLREPALDPVEFTVSGDIGNGSAKQTGARKNTDDVYKDLASHVITRLLAFPGFWKKLTISNICRHGGDGETACMEIPLYFLKAYGRRLHSVVKLQGIREESQLRTMACLPNHGKQGRLYLKADEWRDFANENNLKVGQELLFALIADSFFVVREMLPQSRSEMSRN